MIKKVAHNCFDCFFGTGWDNWIRMRYVQGAWTKIAGDHTLAKGAGILLSRKFKN